MKYMIVVAQTMPDGSIATSMSTHDSEAQAVSAYYSELAAGIISPSLVADAVFVLDSDGHVLATDCKPGAYVPPAPEPEPEPPASESSEPAASASTEAAASESAATPGSSDAAASDSSATSGSASDSDSGSQK